MLCTPVAHMILARGIRRSCAVLQMLGIDDFADEQDLLDMGLLRRESDEDEDERDVEYSIPQACLQNRSVFPLDACGTSGRQQGSIASLIVRRFFA